MRRNIFPRTSIKTLQALCQTSSLPMTTRREPIEAGAPEFIDLITSENQEYQLALGGGMMWLDNTCVDRYGKVYLDCTPAQQKEILDLIAYGKNAKKDPSLGQGIEFFGFCASLPPTDISPAKSASSI